MQKVSIPKGTRDFGPLQVQRRRYILNKIEKVFLLHGFMPLETPTMENLDTLTGKYGDEGDKLLFKILDSGDYFQNLKNQLLPETNNNNSTIELESFYKNYFEHLFHYLIKNSDLYKDQYVDYGIQREIANYNRIHFDNENLSVAQKATKSFFLNTVYVNSIYFKDFLKTHPTVRQNNETLLLTESKTFADEIFNKTYDNFKSLTIPIINLIQTNTNKVTNYISEKGLRYDLTVPFARYVVMNRNSISFPFKRYQMQPVWRADKPQKGRYREFWQCDADVVGSDSLLNEVDLVRVYDEAFRDLGLTNYELRINNRKILAAMAEYCGAAERLTDITIVIDKADKIGMDGVKQELAKQNFNDEQISKILAITNFASADTREQLDFLKSTFAHIPLGLKGAEELEFVFNCVAQMNQPVKMRLDLALARGLSYYTGCIFEVVSTEGTLKSSIGGGGRYDNLTGIFGMPGVSGVGISFGLDRIYDVMEELNLFPDELKAGQTKVLICCFDATAQQYALQPLKALQDAGIAAELFPDLKKLGKQLDYANALQIPFAMIIGDNEMQTGNLMLKNLVQGTQEALPIANVISLLKNNTSADNNNIV